jgi:hypothetical protein
MTAQEAEHHKRHNPLWQAMVSCDTPNCFHNGRLDAVWKTGSCGGVLVSLGMSLSGALCLVSQVQVRLWDDQAKVPGRAVRPLEHYRPMIVRHLHGQPKA